MGTTEIVQALVSPAEKLIEAVSGAIGKAYEPKHIRKIAKRASSRLAYQEITEQQNIEAVVVSGTEETSTDIPLVNSGNAESVSDTNVESTEVLETGTLADADLVADVQQIAGDVRFLLLFVLLSFCWSAIRAWRRNMSGGVK